ncbi:hypothetical protein [Bradyrhizobium septentrionale]|uniref:Uncharacterized protein n=1 Tax=Bradyrhizobium septentrionale TaxID=1404411 RepID=A0ABZ2P5T6_9BRAD
MQRIADKIGSTPADPEARHDVLSSLRHERVWPSKWSSCEQSACINLSGALRDHLLHSTEQVETSDINDSLIWRDITPALLKRLEYRRDTFISFGRNFFNGVDQINSRDVPVVVRLGKPSRIEPPGLGRRRYLHEIIDGVLVLLADPEIALSRSVTAHIGLGSADDENRY